VWRAEHQHVESASSGFPESITRPENEAGAGLNPLKSIYVDPAPKPQKTARAKKREAVENHLDRHFPNPKSKIENPKLVQSA